MLKKIEIRNFKRITEKPMILDDLSQVNYLVGKNGSGKSSVLEAISMIMFDNSTTLLAVIEKQLQDDQNGKILGNLQDKSNKLLSYLEFYQKETIKVDTSIKLNSIEILNKNIELNRLNPFIAIDHPKFKSFFIESGTQNNFKHYQDDKYRDANSVKLNLLTYSLNGQSGLTSDPQFNSQHILFQFFDYFLLYRIRANDLDWLPLLCLINIVEVIMGHTVNYESNLNKIGILVPELKDIFKNINNDVSEKTDTKVDLKEASGIFHLTNLRNLFYELKFNSPDIVLIDEPENTLHPTFQKKIPELIKILAKRFPKVQFIISTHSNYVISAALKQNEEEKETFNLLKKKELRSVEEVKEFDYLSKFYGLDEPKTSQNVYLLEDGQNNNKDSGLPIDFSQFDNTLGNLGVQPSDLLFANGVIWVEGPIDAMYIEKWFTLYQEFKKESDPNFKIYKKGRDYSIQILDTAIWGYTLVNELVDLDKMTDQEKDKIIKLFEVSRKNFVILDQDTDLEVDEENHLKRGLEYGVSKNVFHTAGPRKEELIKSIKTQTKSDHWISDGTIENYLYLSRDSLIAEYKSKVTKFVNKKEVVTQTKNKKLKRKEIKKKLKVDYHFCDVSTTKTKLAKDISNDNKLKFSHFSNCLDDKMFKFMTKVYQTVEVWNKN